MLEETGSGLFDEIEHVLESRGAAVVRIGHFAPLEMRRELQEQPDPVPVLGWTDFEQEFAILLVHREHELELLEVLLGHSPCAQPLEIDAAALRCPTRARVRSGAIVIAMRARRVDLDIELGRALGKQLAEHAFGRRRSADVSHADEQDAARRRRRRLLDADGSCHRAFQVFDQIFHVGDGTERGARSR